MCQQIDSFRAQSFAYTMRQINATIGVASLWTVNLQRSAVVRSMAVAGQLDRLTVLLDAASLHAGKAGFVSAVAFVKVKQAEIAALKSELRHLDAPTVDVVALDADWGRKGRGAKILAWIVATGATAEMVATRFQLAISSAKTYLRRSRRGGK
jgi:hypothetical protein